MSNLLNGLKPNAVWDFFYQLTQIPRPSKHESAIQDFILEFGKKLQLETTKDNIGNIIIKKPATNGYKNRKGVILQSHLDMVAQANKNIQHNFQKDPINAYIDGEWVRAKETTLGADNGIGVATIMSILADKDIEHGPIEGLFTCDEEDGMTGAFGLKADALDGDILLNLDSEDEKELCIGCAGGLDAIFSLPIKREIIEKDYQHIKIVLNGLKGGHSGIDIVIQRANANKLLARFLSDLDTDSWRLIDFSGGDLRNAIPREATANIAIKPKYIKIIKEKINYFSTILKKEYLEVDPNISIDFEALEENFYEVLQQNSQDKFLALISACANGVYRMSTTISGLVETSNNLAIVQTKSNYIVFECLIRSSVDSARDELAEQLKNTFYLSGATADFRGGYPGWQPNRESEILSIMEKTGKYLFGKKPKISAIHAGLECGILGSTYPNLDMISFGPTIRSPHSPDERVLINTVEPFYNWLVLTLKSIPKK